MIVRDRRRRGSRVSMTSDARASSILTRTFMLAIFAHARMLWQRCRPVRVSEQIAGSPGKSTATCPIARA